MRDGGGGEWWRMPFCNGVYAFAGANGGEGLAEIGWDVA